MRYNNNNIQTTDKPATYRQIGLINTALFNLRKKGRLNGKFKYTILSKRQASIIIDELRGSFSFNDLLDQ